MKSFSFKVSEFFKHQDRFLISPETQITISVMVPAFSSSTQALGFIVFVLCVCFYHPLNHHASSVHNVMNFMSQENKHDPSVHGLVLNKKVHRSFSCHISPPLKERKEQNCHKLVISKIAIGFHCFTFHASRALFRNVLRTGPA